MDERADLENKIIDLTNSLQNPAPGTQEANLDLVRRQVVAMTEYRNTLDQRIAFFL